jgi:hypothetical protein
MIQATTPCMDVGLGLGLGITPSLDHLGSGIDHYGLGDASISVPPCYSKPLTALLIGSDSQQKFGQFDSPNLGFNFFNSPASMGFSPSPAADDSHNHERSSLGFTPGRIFNCRRTPQSMPLY